MTNFDKIAEAKMRSDVMQATVELMNLYAQFIRADEGSDLEKALEEQMDSLIGDYMNEGVNGLGGHIILSLCAILEDAAPYENVQQFLNLAHESLQQLVDEAHAD